MNDPFVTDPAEFEYCVVLKRDGSEVALICRTVNELVAFWDLLCPLKMDTDFIQKVTIIEKK